MKLMKMVIRVNKDFQKGDCKNCPLAEYIDSFGQQSCCEGECIDGDCPLEIEELQSDNKDCCKSTTLNI
ncbi:hypothetical protein [Alkaliphilus sp. B6464]|uniref:hypothetical protein n=1 Tax=Alkaliphilus sp. B6464 TaxID=2731219 RepID=UPI001BA84324|nr:hypothetical protein [Alkaliphilus sp. B6464]QUH22210.1 hypothetical protein HYG84_20090 [Alkaliphilus sp. B6464]